MFALVNFNKPCGWTSRQAVSLLKRRFPGVKAGHAGTLDPLATGVLPICLGDATRLVEYLHRLPKRYLATFQLGCRSESLDCDSPIEMLLDAPRPDAVQLSTVVKQFVGSIEQRPPRFSAVKVEGQRAYQLARWGREFDVASRTVHIYRLEIIRYEYPELVQELKCGSGTYIRSLGNDMAEALGTSAVLMALQRTAVGDMHIEDAAKKQTVEGPDESFLRRVDPLIAMLRRVTASDDDVRLLQHGNPLRIDAGWTIEPAPSPDIHAGPSAEIAAITQNGDVAAILAEVHPGLFFPIRHFVSSRERLRPK